MPVPGLPGSGNDEMAGLGSSPSRLTRRLRPGFANPDSGGWADVVLRALRPGRRCNAAERRGQPLRDERQVRTEIAAARDAERLP